MKINEVFSKILGFHFILYNENKVNELYNAIDINKDGSIDFDELKTLFQDAGVKNYDKIICEIFKIFD